MKGDHHRTRVSYTSGSAQSYGTLGIAGTTYEIGFAAARRLLGQVEGAVFLDFGSGAGRSSQFLRDLGAARVLAVDHNEEMIAVARSKAVAGVDFILSNQLIPLSDECVDGAVSFNVFIEFATREAMTAACKEVNRVLRVGGLFVVMTTSPMAFGNRFRTFEYAQPKERESGSTAICTVFTGEGVLELEATYWVEADYRQALTDAGFLVSAVEYPLGDKAAFPDTEESFVAPYVILAAVKGQPSCGRAN